jgi:predicted O-methyltransferase YrrM
MFRNNDAVKVDKAHAETIKGLIYGQKPTKVLELGLGGGESTEAILEGLAYNKQKYEYTLVDNWVDYGYKMPEGVMEMYSDRINVVTSDEKEFVFSTKDKYDFIFSDADHYRTNLWFEYVYDNLLEKDGILIYHDINFFEECLLNLREIYYTCVKRNLKFKLFNRNSLPDERCHRGLLVIFK